MSSIPESLGFDWGNIIVQAIDTTGKVVTSVIDKKTGKTVSTDYGNQQSGGTGFNPSPYIPWVLGGLGVLVALRFLKR
jgi:hypothetical protein